MKLSKIIQKCHAKLSSTKGFTLIELLIVIAVLGVLATATLAAIDPLDKINAGNDSKIQSDISQIVGAAQAFSVSNNGAYPKSLTVADFGSELRSIPTAPNGYTAYVYTAAPGTCTQAAGDCANFSLSGQLKSKKFTSTPKWIYNTTTGRACAVAATASEC